MAYNIRKIRIRTSYSIVETASLLGITRKTCERWIKNKGLKVIEKNVSPLLIMGSDLKNFLKNEITRKKIILKEKELFCLKCRKAVIAKMGSEKIIKTGKRIGKMNKEQFKKTGVCPFCRTKLNKFLGVY